MYIMYRIATILWLAVPSAVLVDTRRWMKQQYLAMPAVMSFLEVSSISSMAKGNDFIKKTNNII